MILFRDPPTKENVSLEVQALNKPELDGIAYLYKMHGPQDKFYSYMVIISQNILLDAEVGFNTDKSKAESKALEDVKQLITQGRYEDLVFYCDPQCPPKPEQPQEPLAKHSARR